MILTINSDCTTMTLTSEEGIINDIVSPAITDCCITLELGTNCCEPTITIPIASLYDFDYSVTNCVPNTALDPDGFTLSITISGISPTCISSFTYPGTNNQTVVTETNPTDLSFTYAYNQYPPSGDIDMEVTLTTCNGLIYTLEFTINALAGCGGLVENPISITYPTFPSGATITGLDELSMTPEFFGLSGSTFPDGVYYVGLVQTTTTDIITEDDSLFVNCGTTCRVIDYISQNLCSDVYVIFDALRLSDNCDVTTYQSKCDLWYYVGKELGYFTDTPCADVSTCKFC